MESRILELCNRAMGLPNCTVHPARPASPVLKPEHLLPEDLAEFYDVCGGIDFYSGGDHEIRILGPEDLKESNIVIVGEQFPDDLSSAWYTIAQSADREYLSIDLSKGRNGRCYDSYFDRHGVVGSCPVVAISFEDLLDKIVESAGGRWPWLEPGFVQLGDAYD